MSVPMDVVGSGAQPPSRLLLPRADSTTKSQSSSSKSTSSGSSTSKCNGSSCTKPTDDSQSYAVAIAVVVPVFVVCLVLAFVLYKVWKRGKKEASEDNDPDFDGDGEYLPSDEQNMKFRELSAPGTFTDSNFEDLELKSQSHATPSHACTPNKSHFPLNPFQLPRGDDAEELRSFARSVNNHELDAYKLASRSVSEVSLVRSDRIFQRPQILARNGKSSSFTSSNMISVESASNWAANDDNLSTQSSVVNGDSTSEMEDSPIKRAPGEVKQGFITSAIGLDPEKSNSESRSSESFVDASREIQEINEVRYTGKDDSEELYLSSKEEENIKRMKSIYEVYLDRNGTVRTVRPSKHGEATDTEPQSNAFVTTRSLPQEAPLTIGHATDLQNGLNAQQSHNEIPTTENQNALQLPRTDDEDRADRRAVSSIYSELPTFPPQSAQPEYHGGQQHYQEEHYVQQPQYQPEYQPNYQQHYAGVPESAYAYSEMGSGPQQYYHPQVLENIEELPNPSNLPFLSSTTSLTSYKKAGKSNLQLQASSINGTSLNPIDHPEYFYNQMSGSNISPSGTTPQSTGQNPILPHHLRQSVVMTNPAELAFPKMHKPAGSFRNISAANSRNNSMTSQHTFQQYQSQLAHQRVSGILDDHDTFPPPRVGGILPHSGSHEELRKQLGSSDNYNTS
ncbi:LAME_0E01640g1_1 [Lachancea meyersii CBS 8951]|uniref:LAME_0E01640g1_1 n=1 Tax=Lachancea meyersii CBS 8951 TaxID=1266667 RepID=A0A1G4JF98_9SACH|nr:LAME_0E01640g1_1 [Lachancea meyersii CBS 8951]